MDLEMPEMDGVTATRAIRRAELARGVPATPVFALTAHALQEYRDQALAAGCDGYIAKPVRMQPLLDAVAGALA
jgi:two-component system sensor histidine kinase/response regulator